MAAKKPKRTKVPKATLQDERLPLEIRQQLARVDMREIRKTLELAQTKHLNDEELRYLLESANALMEADKILSRDEDQNG